MDRVDEQNDDSRMQCIKCGHFTTIDIHDEGVCQVRHRSGFICGCKCVFPATGATTPDLTRLYNEFASRARLIAYDKKQGISQYAVYMDVVDEIFRGLAAAGASEGEQRDIWDRLNKRRHELIDIKKSRLLTEAELTDCAALQRVAGLVRALLTPPLALPAAEGEPREGDCAIGCGCPDDPWNQPSTATPDNPAATAAREIVAAWLWQTSEGDQQRARIDIERRLRSIFAANGPDGK